MCHRTYDDVGPSVGIAIYDDRVEISNPGSFPAHLTAETIKQPHDSHPRNPLIANVLYLSTYLEKWGSGVARIMEACREQGVPEPTYEDRGGFIHIVFKRKSYIQGNEPQNEPQKSVRERLTERQNKILKQIKVKPQITKEELAKIFSMSESTIARDIRSINNHVSVAWKGASKGGHWEIKEKE